MNEPVRLSDNSLSSDKQVIVTRQSYLSMNLNRHILTYCSSTCQTRPAGGRLTILISVSNISS